MILKFFENCFFVIVLWFMGYCLNVYVLFIVNVKYLSNVVYLNNLKYFGISLRIGYVNCRWGYIELKEILIVN